MNNKSKAKTHVFIKRPDSGAQSYFLALDPGVEDGRIGFFIFYGKGGTAISHQFEPHQKAIEMLLAEIEKKLKGKRLSLDAVRGIAVVKGGESFSAVRGIHAIANALGWSLGIPTMRGTEALRHGGIKKVIETFKRRRKFRLLIPEYSREPNITIKPST